MIIIIKLYLAANGEEVPFFVPNIIQCFNVFSLT
jgi:hypothetical protein